jgi:hypothetical protein
MGVGGSVDVGVPAGTGVVVSVGDGVAAGALVPVGPPNPTLQPASTSRRAQ